MLFPLGVDRIIFVDSDQASLGTGGVSSNQLPNVGDILDDILGDILDGGKLLMSQISLLLSHRASRMCILSSPCAFFFPLKVIRTDLADLYHMDIDVRDGRGG